jgi:hypothetical protein
MTAAFSHVARACQMHLSCVSRLARRASDATGLALEAALAKSLVTLCCFWIAYGPVQVRAGSDRSNVDVPRFTAAAWLAKAYRRAAENRLEMPRRLSVTQWRTLDPVVEMVLTVCTCMLSAVGLSPGVSPLEICSKLLCCCVRACLTLAAFAGLHC